MKTTVRTGLLIICLLCFLNTFAQTTKLFSSDGVLSNSLINQIYQDKKGFIWIATEDGLNKFDGTKFTVYKKITGDSTSLKNNYVKTLFEDSSGNFWIGCIDGLQLYDRNTDSFREIKLYQENGQIALAHITGIIERKNGDIWISTSGYGIFSFSKRSLISKNEIQLNKQLCSIYLYTLFEDSQQRIWIGSENEGLNCYNPQTKKLSTYTSAQSPINSNAISSICEDKSGIIFIGTLTGGLYCVDKSGELKSVLKNGTTLPIRTLSLNHTGKLLIGTDGQGMKVYDPQTQDIVSYEASSTPFDFSKTKIYSIMEDKDNNLWTGIYQKGVFFIPITSDGFKYYGYKSFDKNSIGSNCVMSIYKSTTGIIWVGTDNDGLYAINEKNNQVRHYANSENPASVSSTVMCIYEDSKKNIWLGTHLNGLALFDQQTGNCKYFSNPTGNNPSNNKIYSIAEDKSGNLWIGTYGNGIFRFNTKEQIFDKHFFQFEDAPGELCNNWINVLLFDKDNNLWIGTYRGLSCFNPDHSTSFVNYSADNKALPSNVVFSLKEDSNGNLWIGTGDGLVCFDKKTKKGHFYSTKDGLPSNTICYIEEDEFRNIWVSTHFGISKFSPQENTFTNYYASDGLQGNEFRKGAGFKSPDGEIFFGGINGITSFFSPNIHSKKHQLNIYFTDFYLFDKQIRKGKESGGKEIINNSILDADEIHLSADDNVFSFEFSTLEYTNPEGIFYQYKMDNFDMGWNTTPAGINRITYTNLSPGTYHLKVQACDRDNKSEIKTITIIIRPHWYWSFWAKIFYTLLIIALLYGIYIFIRSKIRHKNEILRREHAEQINEAKLQFFINISHEIRTPMTLIIGPLEKLLSENKNLEIQKSYLLVYRNAQRILRLINQLMDIRKIDRGQMKLKSRETDMVGFIEDIMQAFDYTAKQKNIRFIFEHNMPMLKVWVDLNNFDKVLFNIYSNAFKYTPNDGEIITTLTTGNDNSVHGPLKNYFEIQIKDNGIGIDKDKIEQIFERFYQIRNGITESKPGTGIGLHLSRSLVELQYGKIFAQTIEDGKGSIFIIRIPLGKDHLKPDEIEIIPEEKPLATFEYSKKDNLFENMIENEETTSLKPKTKYHILLAEDEMDISNYIKNELSSMYKIHQSVNGKEALDFILKEKPDLVVSDIMMPEMDGITLCRKIKSNINIDHIPVILLTAKSKEEDIAEGLDIGADAYIVKPFNAELLKKTISNLLKNRELLKGKFNSRSEGKIEKVEMKSSDEILMEKVIKIVNENLANPDLNVEMLSSRVGMSRVHMHRKLKELTNLSARDFIRNIRLKQAGELLLSKKYSISDVAYAVGFSTLSHFSSSFKEFYGMSPKEYVEKVKN